jgi:hypothetical protein
MRYARGSFLEQGVRSQESEGRHQAGRERNDDSVSNLKATQTEARPTANKRVLRYKQLMRRLRHVKSGSGGFTRDEMNERS